jgi:hypothetical protein
MIPRGPFVPQGAFSAPSANASSELRGTVPDQKDMTQRSTIGVGIIGANPDSGG